MTVLSDRVGHDTPSFTSHCLPMKDAESGLFLAKGCSDGLTTTNTARVGLRYPEACVQENPHWSLYEGSRG